MALFKKKSLPSYWKFKGFLLARLLGEVLQPHRSSTPHTSHTAAFPPLLTAQGPDSPLPFRFNYGEEFASESPPFLHGPPTGTANSSIGSLRQTHNRTAALQCSLSKLYAKKTPPPPDPTSKPIAQSAPSLSFPYTTRASLAPKAPHSPQPTLPEKRSDFAAREKIAAFLPDPAPFPLDAPRAGAGAEAAPGSSRPAQPQRSPSAAEAAWPPPCPAGDNRGGSARLGRGSHTEPRWALARTLFLTRHAEKYVYNLG